MRSDSIIGHASTTLRRLSTFSALMLRVCTLMRRGYSLPSPTTRASTRSPKTKLPLTNANSRAPGASSMSRAKSSALSYISGAPMTSYTRGIL